MSNLISGKEALIALANDEEVEIKMDGNWLDCDHLKATQIYMVIDDYYKFRLKPKTISINGVEVIEPNDLVLDPITGSVGLVYGDIDRAKNSLEALRKVFNQSEVA